VFVILNLAMHTQETLLLLPSQRQSRTTNIARTRKHNRPERQQTSKKNRLPEATSGHRRQNRIRHQPHASYTVVIV